MKVKFVVFWILSMFLCALSPVWAQKTNAQKKIDSIKKVEKKRISDSLLTIKKYKKSHHYKDSVARAIRTRKATERAIEEAKDDSIKKVKQLEEEKAKPKKPLSKADSIKQEQAKKKEAIEKAKKYKTSKRFEDSVTIRKRNKEDSLKNAQQSRKDSLTNARKSVTDALAKDRKHVADSIKRVRTRALDSIKRIRTRKADSLAKAKSSKNNQFKAKEKQIEKKKALALELKIKQKREAFSNKNMLKKRWSAIRRLTQNSFTHYNYFYNANRKMEEAEDNMLRNIKKEQYDSLLWLYPFNPDKDSSLLSGDMDSIIRKVSVGVQIHDPRVKWANDMFLLMGQAYYYKGNYDNAAATFRYIISYDEEVKSMAPKTKTTSTYKKKPTPKQQISIVEDEKKGLDFLKHRSVHNDAILWLARTYTQWNLPENAGAVIALLESDPKLPEDLKGKIAEVKAFMYLKDDNVLAASPQLEVMIEDDNLPNWLRMRAAFINGQIMQTDKKYAKAALNFDRCLDFFPNLEMDFYARKLVAYNTLMAGNDVGDGMKPLKRVLDDHKYNTYHDQVYFVLGKLAAKAGKNDDAIQYLNKSTEMPKATKKQKALSFAALGDVYYSLGNYGSAKNAYDSCNKYAGAAMSDSSIIAAIARSKGLAEISVPANIIREQDSLLDLANSSKKEQLKAVKDLIKQLERKRQDSILKAADDLVAGDGKDDKDASDAGSTSSWYFANKNLMQQGSAEFKRKWGTRPLVDNWRRGAGAASASAIGGGGGVAEGTTEAEPEADSTGLPTEASLLAKIPNTPEQQRQAHLMIQKAYMQLAKGYYNQLEDYNKSAETLDTLDRRYANHNYKEDELYLRYQIAMRLNNLDKAKEYSAALLSSFPTSEYAAILKPKGDDNDAASKTIDGQTVVAYYDETYNMILAHQYPEALKRIATAKATCKHTTFLKRFAIAEALCYGGQGKYDNADSLLSGFIKSNPSDSLVGWANDMVEYIKDVRKNGVPSWYNDKQYADMYNVKRKTVPKVEDIKPKKVEKPKVVRPADVPELYSYKPEEPHSAIIILPGLDSRLAPLKVAIQDYNKMLGLVDTAAMIYIDMYGVNQTIVRIGSFANATDAMAYIDTLVAGEVLAKYSGSETKNYIISDQNYKKMYFELKPAPYQSFYKSYYVKPE